MKKLSILLLTLLCLNAGAQVIADPGFAQIVFTDLSGAQLPDTLPLGYVARLNIPISNSDALNALPAGSCKIKVGLGSKMIVQPSFALGSINTSQYFSWSVDFIGGQYQISGELVAPLPAGFSDTAQINVQGSVLGYSTITANFLVSNHNTSVILSDGDPTNNSSFRQYKIVETVVPVTFTGLSVTKKECNLLIRFNTEDEINVARFYLELSKDGRRFVNAASIAAAGNRTYELKVPITADIEGQLVYLRIRSIDLDQRFGLSQTITTNATCKENSGLSVFPNPVIHESKVTIQANGALLNGSYQAMLTDAAGRRIAFQNYTFINTRQFQFAMDATLASGQYLLKLLNQTNGSQTVFKIQKLR